MGSKGVKPDKWNASVNSMFLMRLSSGELLLKDGDTFTCRHTTHIAT